MKVLIIGGTGQISREIARLALTAGDELTRYHREMAPACAPTAMLQMLPGLLCRPRATCEALDRLITSRERNG